MIVTRTPLRVSFFGGGTDLREYFLCDGGMVVSTAIDKYVYVVANPLFEEKISIGPFETDSVLNLDDLRHDLIRECLRKTGIRCRVAVAVMSDVPSDGSGLGASSAAAVGMLNAMYVLGGASMEPARLAREACDVEIGVLGKPIGVQDQYIAAYGGQRIFRFHRDGTIETEPLCLDPAQAHALERALMLFYIARVHTSDSILREQRQRISRIRSELDELKALAGQSVTCLRRGLFEQFGQLLHQSWQIKKTLASGITNERIDAAYLAARRAGAIGGKVCGAGAGGFLLLYCPPSRQGHVRAALSTLHELRFRFESGGSQMVFPAHPPLRRPEGTEPELAIASRQ